MAIGLYFKREKFDSKTVVNITMSIINIFLKHAYGGLRLWGSWYI